MKTFSIYYQSLKEYVLPLSKNSADPTIIPLTKTIFQRRKKTKKTKKKIVLIRDIYIKNNKGLPLALLDILLFFIFSSLYMGKYPLMYSIDPNAKKVPVLFLLSMDVLIHTNNSLEILYMMLLVQSAENLSMTSSCVRATYLKKRNEISYIRDFSNIIFNVNIFTTVNIIQQKNLHYLKKM